MRTLFQVIGVTWLSVGVVYADGEVGNAGGGVPDGGSQGGGMPTYVAALSDGLVVVELASGHRRRVPGPASEEDPRIAWSPGGEAILYLRRAGEDANQLNYWALGAPRSVPVGPPVPRWSHSAAMAPSGGAFPWYGWSSDGSWLAVLTPKDLRVARTQDLPVLTAVWSVSPLPKTCGGREPIWQEGRHALWIDCGDVLVTIDVDASHVDIRPRPQCRFPTPKPKPCNWGPLLGVLSDGLPVLAAESRADGMSTAAARLKGDAVEAYLPGFFENSHPLAFLSSVGALITSDFGEDPGDPVNPVVRLPGQPPVRSLSGRRDVFDLSFSRSGRWAVYVSTAAESGAFNLGDVYLVRAGTNRPKRVLAAKANGPWYSHPVLSPD